MTLKVYITGITFATLLALVSFLFIISFFSPENADAFLIGLVFFSLFVALAGILGLFSFFIRKKGHQNQAPFRFLGISFRQGALLSFLLTGSLALRTFGIFWWWSGVILLVLVLIIEFLFLRMQK